MRIAVAGLGIIGASLTRALKENTEHTVDGWNRTRAVTAYALKQGYIHGSVADFTAYDVVFIALPPKASAEFLETHNFRDGAIVADICGMKKFLAEKVASAPHNYRYVGTHPMAGKETAGIEFSSADLFRGANIVLVQSDSTDKEALQTIADLYAKMGAGKLIVCPASYHDGKIAYTSQLPHLISNAYVKSPSAKNCLGFTGGSFQDMARVAAFNEEIWTNLFFLNRENLTAELQTLIGHLSEYLDALKEGDEEKMKALIREGNAARERLPLGGKKK